MLLMERKIDLLHANLSYFFSRSKRIIFGSFDEKFEQDCRNTSMSPTIQRDKYLKRFNLVPRKTGHI